MEVGTYYGPWLPGLGDRHEHPRRPLLQLLHLQREHRAGRVGADDDNVLEHPSRRHREQARPGLGRIVALRNRSSTLYQIHLDNRCVYF
jgi:hypothetical protein